MGIANGAIIVTVSNPKSIRCLTKPLLDKIPLIFILKRDKLHSQCIAGGICLLPISTLSLKLDIALTFQSLDKIALEC